ncbi:MAG TPA: hypothetical protein VGC30_02940, partial [Dokdonella sp.]
RNILEADALRIPGKLENVRRLVAAGERTRVFDGLPMKMIVVDRRIALIPLDIARASESALLLRPSSLLEALCVLFEMLWRRATPIVLARAGALVEDAPPARAGARAEPDQLVPLLAAGMNDKAIAHRLGVSARTLERRIVELSRELEARTRFQAGWRAALRSVGLD